MEECVYVYRVCMLVFLLVTASVCYLFINYIFWSFVMICLLYIMRLTSSIDSPSKEDPNGKFVLITGCDTGYGNLFAIRAHQLGFTVFACCKNNDTEGARELARLDESRLHVLEMDVSQNEDVNSSLKYVSRYCKTKGLWALVNAIDVAGGGPVELCSVDHYQHMCNVSLIGTVRVTKAFLPLVRQAKGRIINMSIEEGLISKEKTSSYCMPKYGLEAFTDCLREEMKMFYVQVSLIEVKNLPSHVEVQKMARRLFEEFHSASADVQNAYPWDAVDKLVKSKYEALSHLYVSPSEVLDILQCQLIRSKILPRYLVLENDWNPYRTILRLRKYPPQHIFSRLFEQPHRGTSEQVRTTYL